MKNFQLKKVAIILILVLVFNLVVPGIAGISRVEAGFWDDHQGSILTVVKGLVMLWIINLMTRNSSGNGNDDLITSTIKKGLNLDDSSADSPDKPLDSPGADELTDNSSDDSRDNSRSDESLDKTVTSPDQMIIEENSANRELTVMENELVRLVNEKRREKGLNSVEVDLNLVEVARKKARDMIENNYFDHNSPIYGTPFDMIREEGINYSLAGENLAGAETVEKAFSSLMDSPEHRDNILKSRYDRIGIAVLKGGPYGLMVVQLFIDSPDPAR